VSIEPKMRPLLSGDGISLNNLTMPSAPPRRKPVYSWPTSSRTPAAMTRAWGATAWGRPGDHPGPRLFRPLRVKGLVCALTERAALVLRGNVCAPAACPLPRWTSAGLLRAPVRAVGRRSHASTPCMRAWMACPKPRHRGALVACRRARSTLDEFKSAGPGGLAHHGGTAKVLRRNRAPAAIAHGRMGLEPDRLWRRPGLVSHLPSRIDRHRSLSPV
jgi:hypothetical protein